MKFFGFTLTLLLCFVTHSGFAQDNSVSVNLPPAPEAAGIARYGDIPVSQFTGIPSISVPVFTATYRDLAVPIGLSYHAGGIRVADEASWVGLGWSLNAGGMITRSIRGYDDFGTGLPPPDVQVSSAPNVKGYYDLVKDGEIPTAPIIDDGCWSSLGGLYFVQPYPISCEVDGPALLEPCYGETLPYTPDYESDLYTFSFGGGSGKFVFDKNGEPMLLEASDIEIKKLDGDGWTITTSNGYTYYFGTVPNTIQKSYNLNKSSSGFSSQSHINSYVSAWHLYSIESPQGVMTYFNYEKEENKVFPVPSASQNQSNALGTFYPFIGSFFNYGPNIEDGGLTFDDLVPQHDIANLYFGNFIRLGCSSENTTWTASAVKYDRVSLSGIEMPYHRQNIVFNSSDGSSREDLRGGDRLDNIQVFQGGVLLRTAYFDYSYFDAGSTAVGGFGPLLSGNAISFPQSQFEDYQFEPNFLNKRLKLDAVRIVGGADTEEYSFEYSDAVNLPSKTSTSVDWWGYFNGENNGAYLMPQVDLAANGYSETYYAPRSILLGAIKDAGEASFVGANTIKSIKYPTGGYSRFNFENNIYGLSTTGPGLRVKKVESSPAANSPGITQHFIYQNEMGFNSGRVQQPPKPFSTYKEVCGNNFSGSLGDGTSFNAHEGFLYISRSSSSALPLSSSYFGDLVGYSNVKTVNGDGGSGYSRHEFFPIATFGTPHSEVVGAGVPYYSNPASGNLLKTTLFNKENIIVQETTNNYVNEELERNWNYILNVRGLYYPYYAFLGIPGSNAYNCDNGSLSYEHYMSAVPLPITYPDVQYWNRMTGSTATTFNEDGRVVVQTTSTTYDPINFAVKRTEMSGPGASQFTEYTYAHELGASQQHLLDAHMTGVPVIVETHVGSKYITDYDPTSLLPRKFTEQFGDSGDEVVHTEVLRFDSEGNPLEVQKHAFPLNDTYVWNDGLMESHSYGDLTQSIDYFPNRMLKSKTAADGQKVEYTYDGLQRLKTMVARGGEIETTIDYDIGSGNNSVTQTTSFSGENVIQVATYDGLGRPIATSINGVQKGLTIYDEYGRVSQQTYLPGLGGMTTQVYAPDPLRRTVEQIFPDGASISTKYLTGDSPYDGYAKLEMTDEVGNISSTVTDILGRAVLQIDALGGETEYSYTSFDAISNISPPIGAGYGYGYDARRRLVSKTIPGQGTTQYGYDQDDLLKSTKLPNNKVVYIAYDDYNREIATSKTNGGGVTNGGGRFTLVDIPGDILTRNTYGNTGIEIGKLVRQEVAFLLPNSVVGDMITTDFNIDHYGRVASQRDNYILDGIPFEDAYTFGLSMRDLPVSTSVSHRDYSTGNIAKSSQSQGFDEFARLTLSSSSLSWNDGSTALSSDVTNTNMTYNNGDQLTRRVLLQSSAGGSYREAIGYNSRGWLTSINNTRGRTYDAGICGDPRGNVYEGESTNEEMTLEDIFNMLQNGDPLTIDDLSCEPDGDYDNCVDNISDSSVGTHLGFNSQGLAFPFATGPDNFSRLQLLETLCPSSDFSPAYDLISMSGDTSIGATSPMVMGRSELGIVHFGYWRRYFQITTIKVTDNVSGSEREVHLPGAPYVFPTDPYFFNDSQTDLPGYISSDDALLEIAQERERFTTDFTDWMETNQIRYDSVYWGSGVAGLQKKGFAIYLSGAEISLAETCIDYLFEMYLQCERDEKVKGPVLYTTTDSYCHVGESGNHQIVPCTNQDGNTDDPDISVLLTTSSVPTTGLIKDPNQVSYPTKLYQLNRNPDASDHLPYSNFFFSEELDDVSKEMTIGKIFKINSSRKTFEIELSNGNVHQVNTDQLINYRKTAAVVDVRPTQTGGALGGNVIGPTGYTNCDNSTPVCTAEETQQQLDQVSSFYDQMTPAYISGLTFPLTLYSVTLCDGTTAYLTGDQVTNLTGAYVIANSFSIAGAGSLIGVTISGSVNQLFGLNLSYRPNGNISSGRWKNTYHSPKKYAYKYDALNRITSAKYSQATVTTINDLVSARDMFSVDNISYDAIGNIKTLTRQGAAVINGTLTKGDIDVLSYSYFDEGTPTFSSQLKSVSDVANITELKSVGFSDGGALATASYGYSANGSMEGDPYRGLTLEYNHLDLPSEITTPDGLMTIIYDATGRKWLQKTNDGSRMYVGGIELYKIEKDGENYTVEAAATAGGRLVYDPEGGKDGTGEIYPEYHHRDHLGNTRVAFTDRNEDGKVEVLGPNNEVTQQLDYYPFGMAHDVECLFEIGDGTNRYRYNGKEFSEEIGLYDYGARWYDPSIARWTSVDPLASSMASWSPYNYVYNNPLKYTDPTGMAPFTDYYNQNGKHVKNVKDGSNAKVMVMTGSKNSKKVDAAIASGQTAPVASEAVITAMDAAYDMTATSGNETGFAVGVNGSVSSLDQASGDDGSVNLTTERAELSDNGEPVAYDVHTHPEGGEDGYYGSPMPSEADKTSFTGINDTQNSVILGFTAKEVPKPGQENVIGQKQMEIQVTKSIGFYNSSGSTGTMNYDRYKRVSRKINKQ